MPELAPEPVAAYLGHVRALIETAQADRDPGSLIATETEHAMVTDLFPGFLGAVEAAWNAHPSQMTANGLQVCPNCTRDMGVFVPADRCPTYADLTTELLSKGETDEH